jgi:hypothetical protein
MNWIYLGIDYYGYVDVLVSCDKFLRNNLREDRFILAQSFHPWADFIGEKGHDGQKLSTS